jgi:DNA polymerase I-like protein with 3'-5' exonuclease and polymerase domains
MLREVMENVYTLRVPLQVDVEMGHNWEEMEDMQ